MFPKARYFFSNLPVLFSPGRTKSRHHLMLFSADGCIRHAYTKRSSPFCLLFFDVTQMPEPGIFSGALLLLLVLALVFLFMLRKSQVAFRSDAQYLRSVIDHLDVGIVTFNGTIRHRTYNAAAQKLLSCPDLRLHVDSFLKTVIGEGDHGNVYSKGTEGSPGTYVKMSGRRLPAPKNEPVSAVIVLQDITAEKEVERKLVEANRELDSFCYSISHDLRAPLRTINGFSRILLEDYGRRLDKEAERLCNVIIRGGERMGKLIDDLLEFSRISKHDISPSALNMRALFNAAAGKLFGDQQTPSVNLTINELPRAWGDRDLIAQVIMNLLSNAFKYSSRAPQPEVEVGAERNGEEVTYYVKDNGVGFDMQYYDKLFEVFQRLHGRTEFEGTGVGLSIVDRIIKRHGGKVWAISSPGNGATFYFTLRAATETEKQEP